MVTKFFLALVMVFMSFQVTGQDVKTFIPERAKLYLPLMIEKSTVLPKDFPSLGYVGSLIEVESCVTMTHKRCWSPTSTLDTSREFGAGFVQITKAYNKDGSVRFDTLRDLRTKYRESLSELTWDNIKTQPGLQMTAGMLLIGDNYKALYQIKDPIERMRMSDSAHNRGLGNLTKDRRACGLAAGCNPQLWFDNVERYCVGPNAVIYGTRTACQINRHHVVDATIIRLPKYEKAVKALQSEKKPL